MNLERVGKNSTFARDNNTGAILNTDQEAIVRSREMLKKKKQEKEEIVQMKSDISEIKSLLSTLLQNIGGKWLEKLTLI